MGSSACGVSLKCWQVLRETAVTCRDCIVCCPALNIQGVHLHSIKVMHLLSRRKERFYYDDALKKEKRNLRVQNGRCYEYPDHVQSPDRGNAGCVWIYSARESVGATVPRHQLLLLQVC